MPNETGGKAAFKLLEDEIRKRQWLEGQSMLNTMAALYEGNLPPEFDKFFPDGEPKHVVNLVKLAWNDLATQIGRLPDLRGDPLNSGNAEMKRVGMLERIGFGYLRKSKPNAKLMMYNTAWWLVGGGRAVTLVVPDLEHQTPIFVTKDPRTCYPKARETSGKMIVELDNLIFKYELDVDEMQARGLATSPSNPLEGTTFTSTGGGERRKGTVIEYIDEQIWMIVSDGGTVQTTNHGLGVVPGWVFQTFSPDSDYGLSQFKDQVSFMVGISRLITQKMAFNDRVVWPITWVKGHQGKIKIGPHVINKLSAQGEMGQLAPVNQIQVDRDIEQMTQFSRILNRNPEVRQGEVQAKGTYTSAKTLEQLAEAIDTVIGQHWDIIGVGMQKLMEVAYRMDEKLWGNVTKTTTGIAKGKKFREEYTPNKDINGRYYINVEYGFGIGGYQGFLQNLQALEAKTLPRRRVIEEMPGVWDVDSVLREIEIETMDEAGHAGFAALAANGQLDMVIWAKIRKDMAKKGMTLNEGILKYQDELQEQATAATAAEGGPEALTTPPLAQTPGGGDVGGTAGQEALPGLPTAF